MEADHDRLAQHMVESLGYIRDEIAPARGCPGHARGARGRLGKQLGEIFGLRAVTMYSLLLAGVAVLLTITPCVSAAQVQDDLATRDIVFEELKDGQWVRPAGPVLGRHEGRLWRGTKIGALIGTLTGALAGAMVTGSSSDQNLTAGEGFLIGGGGGLVLGGLVGTLVGSSTQSWHRRYP